MKHGYEPRLAASFKDCINSLISPLINYPVVEVNEWSGSSNRFGRCGVVWRDDSALNGGDFQENNMV